jgi:hypothetical protein
MKEALAAEVIAKEDSLASHVPDPITIRAEEASKRKG